MGLDLKIKINSLPEFYQEADNVEIGGNYSDWEHHNKSDTPSFRGLSLAEIKESKWSYTKGLDNLKEIDKDIQLGGRKHVYKYDDSDGDDMNMDRYLEGLPCMRKRVQNHGKGTGKLVNLHISICENCWCSAKNLLIRSYTAMRIIDMLELQGYRVQVTAYADNKEPGYILRNGGHEYIDTLQVEVVIKKFEDPLIKGQILTAISPWFFRYWMFKFWTAKFKMRDGLGQAISPVKEESISDIYIQTGEALTEPDAEKTITRISKLFDIVE